MELKEWVVYLLICQDQTVYTGITNNLDNRIKAHNQGKGAKYTKSRRPVKLLKFFPAENKSLASKLEFKIKKLSKEKKLNLDQNQINILINQI